MRVDREAYNQSETNSGWVQDGHIQLSGQPGNIIYKVIFQITEFHHTRTICHPVAFVFGHIFFFFPDNLVRSCSLFCFMFSRLSQVARHLSKPRPNFGHISAAAAATSTRPSGLASRIMASAEERNTRTIHTAACLIIGDEVLGGKV